MARYLTRWQLSMTLGAAWATFGASVQAYERTMPLTQPGEVPNFVAAASDGREAESRPRLVSVLVPSSSEQTDEEDEPLTDEPNTLDDSFSDQYTDENPIESPSTESAIEVIRERYPDRKVKIEREVSQDSQGNYLNHGSWKMWSPKGTIMAQGQYAEGERDGVWHRWHLPADADLFAQLPYQQYPGPYISQATFNKGQIDGQWTIFDAKQRKISEWNYKAGVRHGLSTWWYANGKVMREANYLHGDLDGELKEYNVNGQLVLNDTYQQGRKLATKADFYNGGKQKKTEGVYLHAKVVEKAGDDWWNAIPATTMQIGKDERHGPWAAWFTNGQLQIQGEYKNDAQVGQFTWWYANGQKKSEGSYEEGLPHGRWIWWHTNGQKASQGQYERGELVGMWNGWDEAGKMVQAEDHSDSPVRTAEQPKNDQTQQ